MKKNSFFAFCFAFIPGAGQMYLGMMKRGVSLMLAFSVISVAAGFLYLPILTVFLPVLWFFAFFDTSAPRRTPSCSSSMGRFTGIGKPWSKGGTP